MNAQKTKSYHISAAAFQRDRVCSIRRWSDKGALKFYRVGSSGDRRYRARTSFLIGWEGQLLLEKLTPPGDVLTFSRS